MLCWLEAIHLNKKKRGGHMKRRVGQRYIHDYSFCQRASSYVFYKYIALHWCSYIMPTSLFYYINGHFFKFATNHKELSQACPHSILMHFSQGSIPESLVKKKSKLTKLFNVCWNHVLFILFRRSNFQQMLNNFANFEFFMKLSGVNPCENALIY